MRFIEEDDEFRLSTGSKFYANRGCISLNEEGELCEGYDGGIDEDKLNDAEKREIALYMIEQWSRFIFDIDAKNYKQEEVSLDQNRRPRRKPYPY